MVATNQQPPCTPTRFTRASAVMYLPGANTRTTRGRPLPRPRQNLPTRNNLKDNPNTNAISSSSHLQGHLTTSASQTTETQCLVLLDSLGPVQPCLRLVQTQCLVLLDSPGAVQPCLHLVQTECLVLLDPLLTCLSNLLPQTVLTEQFLRTTRQVDKALGKATTSMSRLSNLMLQIQRVIQL